MFKTNRMHTYPVDTLIINRWSSRAFSPEPLSQQELMSLFEAARWAQSCFNNQPWRFLYALNPSPYWDTFLRLLVPQNQEWASYAYALIVVISKNSFDHNGQPNKTHSFDTGAAAQNMALQGASMNIIVHGMAGFDYDRARTELNIPDDYTIEAMFAVGKYSNDTQHLSEKNKIKEIPSDRKSIADITWQGTFLDKK